MAKFKLHGAFAVLIFWRQMLIANNFKYKVTSWNECVEPGDNFVKLVDVTIAECVDACVRRQACKSVGYRRRFRLCEIHKEKTLITNTNEESCIFIERKDMDTTDIDASKCNCSHVGHECDLGSGFCEMKECGHLDLLNGKINGNMHFIGAKIRVSCDQGYTESNGITQATCNSTGDWDPTPRCEMIPTTSLTTTADTTISAASQTTPSTTTIIKEYYCPYEGSSYRNYNLFDLHNDGVIIDNKSSITFDAKGGHDAHILLQYDRNVTTSNVVEILIGGWINTVSQIRYGIDGLVKSQFGGNILNFSSYVPLWISWNSGCVKVGKGNVIDANLIMDWCGPSFSISGMRISYCCGTDGYVRFSI